MLRLLRFLWTGSWHEHEWETINEGQIWNWQKKPIASWYDLRCKHCGDIKQRTLR